jgi:quinol-cytochrome oxidoreductase complex cytochrome b subunit
MHYTPHVDFAFNSVEHIMRDVNSGWLLRYVTCQWCFHVFYCGTYCHIFRGLYYGILHTIHAAFLWMCWRSYLFF